MIPSKQITLGYVISGGGWVLFALGFFGMLGEHLSPLESEHAYTFFRNVGWLVTCGWLLQLWETSARARGIRRRITPLVDTARQYVIPVFVAATVLMLITFAVLLFMSTD